MYIKLNSMTNQLYVVSFFLRYLTYIQINSPMMMAILDISSSSPPPQTINELIYLQYLLGDTVA